MKEIRFNLVARIHLDKDFFAGPIQAVKKAAEEGLPAYLTLMGAIQHQGLYNKLLRLIADLDVADRVTFTERSIPFRGLSEEKRQEYFINYCLGDFIGYSSIEGLNIGLKTMFFNIGEENLSSKMMGFACYCHNVNAIVEKYRMIQSDRVAFDKRVVQENTSLKNGFLLKKDEKDLLLSIL